MAHDQATIEDGVFAALREVLGYVPESTDDLAGAVDSMQKLELLVTLEERFSIPFEDDAVSGEWWQSRDGIVSYVRSQVAPESVAEVQNS